MKHFPVLCAVIPGSGDMAVLYPYAFTVLCAVTPGSGDMAVLYPYALTG